MFRATSFLVSSVKVALKSLPRRHRGETRPGDGREPGVRMGMVMKICVFCDRNSVRSLSSIPKKCRVRTALTVYPPYDIPLFEGETKRRGPEAIILTLQEQIIENILRPPDSTSASTVVHPQAKRSCIPIFTCKGVYAWLIFCAGLRRIMSRPLRMEYPEAWYNVMNKGRRGESVFPKG